MCNNEDSEVMHYFTHIWLEVLVILWSW